jgi:hypothetical protein
MWETLAFIPSTGGGERDKVIVYNIHIYTHVHTYMNSRYLERGLERIPQMSAARKGRWRLSCLPLYVHSSTIQVFYIPHAFFSLL